MSRPTLLDLCCKAGGTSVGYCRAGFDVTGVDIEPQPNYPYEFHRADALRFLWAYGGDFDAIAASPPCQAHSSIASMSWKSRRPRISIIEPLREMLVRVGRPYVIENVPGAPLHSPIKLCGSHFDLGVRRHRLFESTVPLTAPVCNHKGRRIVGVYGDHPEKSFIDSRRKHGGRIMRAGSIEEARAAMGIDWMDWKELTQAIPPAYTEYIGKQLLSYLA